jgi:pSer/pThr/pTyr-binding forkhead associated (FHA) protein
MSRFQKVCLIKILHGDKVEERVYEHNTLIIGRSTEAHIGIPDPGVSRQHFELSLKHGRLWITDLGSANGTTVNGTKIQPKTKVSYNEGELIQVGSSRVGMAVTLIEKAFDLRSVENSNLDDNEKENLIALVQSAHAEAERIAKIVKEQTEQAINSAESKASHLISQANFRSDEIISAANTEAGRIKEDSQRKYAEAILRAEKDAQEAAGDVFRRAEKEVHDAELKAKEILSEAERHRQEAVSKVQDECQTLFQQGRQNIQELRIAWEEERQKLNLESKNKILETESQARTRAEEILSAADKQKLIVLNQASEQFELAKAEALEKAAQYFSQAEVELKAAQKRAQELVMEATQEGQRIIEKFNQEGLDKKQMIIANAESQAQLHLAESDATIAQSKAAADQKFSALKRIADSQQAQIDKDAISLKELTENLQKTDLQLQNVTRILSEKNNELQELQNTINTFAADKIFVLSELTRGKEELATLTETRKKAVLDADQVKQDADRYKSQVELECQELRDQARKEVEGYKAREAEAVDKLKLEEIQKLKEYRTEADKSLNRHRSDLINELLRLTEAHILTMVKPSLPASFEWQPVTTRLKSEVRDALEEMVYKSTNHDEGTNVEEVVNKKASQFLRRLKIIGWSAAAIVIILVSFRPARTLVSRYFLENDAATTYSKQMRAERDRRFIPEKKLEWRDSYTEALLYSEGFVELKLDSKYQDQWIRDLHEYLYGKLRVDEDSIVRLVSLEAAMVTKLKEQADTIHPDYVNEQISKMKEMESDTVKQMRQIIGSNEKYEKFRKFSQDYYYHQMDQRAPAQNRQ